MDHDDALTKLDQVPESEGEPPGELLDAGERLNSWVSSTAALLLSLQTDKQLWTVEGKRVNIWRRADDSALDFRTRVEQPYLLQTEHQRTSALDLIHLSGPVQRLLDDVSEIVVVLRTKSVGSLLA